MRISSPPKVEPAGPSARLLLLIYGACAALWAVAAAWQVARFLRFEDAMIVLRYARNLVEGSGFVFNVGERVLGVTTPLHTLISTVYVAMGGLDGAPFLQNLSGVLMTALEGGLLVLLLARWGKPWAALPAGLWILGSFNLSWLYFGMETHLFVALGLAVLIVAAEPVTRRHDMILGLLLGIAFLVRYDAALLAALVGFERWLRTRRFPWRMTAIFFLLVTPWLVFAQIYFGSILPEPLRAKQGYAASTSYLQTLAEYYRGTFERLLLAYSPSTRAAIWSSFALPLVLLWGGAVALRSHPGFRLFVLYAPLHVLVYAGLGSDPNFTWHHYLLNPFGFALVALAAQDLLFRLSSLPFAVRALGAETIRRRVAWILLFVACLPVGLHLEKRLGHAHQPDDLTFQLHLMGDWLQENYPPETSVLQPAIGILGWRSGLRLVDHAGLVTPGLYFYDDIHCTPLSEVFDAHRPDLILQSPWAKEDPADFGYEPVHTFDNPFAYVVYERADLN